MATNVWPKFSDSGWDNEGVSILSQGDYAIFFTATEEWLGMCYEVPAEWKGKYLTVGCAGISGGGIYFLDANYDELVSPIESTTETTFFLSLTAKYLYVMSPDANATVYLDAVYLYVGENGGSGGDGGDGEEIQVVTLRPVSVSGSNWTNPAYIYDTSSSTGGTVSATYNTYTSCVLTCTFDTSSIPKNAIITSATLSIRYSQSNSTSSRRYSPYIDINGNSSNRVISSQLENTSTVTNSADVKSYISSLKTITITPYRAGISGSNVLTVYDMNIIVNYQESPAIQNVFLGSTKIADIYLGTTKISKVYLGTSVIFEK